MKSLNENSDSKKSRDGFIEATRALELMNFAEVEGLAETMFKGGMWDTHILEFEEARALDGDTVPIIILLFTQDGITESEVFGNSMVFCLY